MKRFLSAALVLLMLLPMTGCKKLLKTILKPFYGETTEAPTAAPDTEEPDETDFHFLPGVTETPEPTSAPEPTPTPEPDMPPAPLAFTVGWENPVGSAIMCGVVSKNGELCVWNHKTETGGYGANFDAVSEDPVLLMNGVASVYGAGTVTLALKADGTLWAFEVADRLEPFMIADGVATAAGGGEISAFIRFDGSLFTVKNCDLKRTHGEIPMTKLMDDARAVSCGGKFLAAIKNDNSLWTWGNNEHGQLGDKSVAYRPEPVVIMQGVKSVDCADRSAVAVTLDGDVYVWGYSGRNTSWEDTELFYNTPTLVMSGAERAVCSESVGRTLLVLKEDGAVWLWNTTPNADGDGYATGSSLLMEGCAFFCFGNGMMLLVKDDGALYAGSFASTTQNGLFKVICGDTKKIFEETWIP